MEFTLRLFKYKFKLATAIGVVFNMIDDVDYTVEWMILASENEYDEYYEQILKEEKPWENGKKLPKLISHIKFFAVAILSSKHSSFTTNFTTNR
ncbi:MAG: hypothetical protein ACLSEV_09615 [Coprococcus sp.]